MIGWYCEESPVVYTLSFLLSPARARMMFLALSQSKTSCQSKSNQEEQIFNSQPIMFQHSTFHFYKLKTSITFDRRCTSLACSLLPRSICSQSEKANLAASEFCDLLVEYSITPHISSYFLSGLHHLTVTTSFVAMDFVLDITQQLLQHSYQ